MTTNRQSEKLRKYPNAMHWSERKLAVFWKNIRLRSGVGLQIISKYRRRWPVVEGYNPWPL
jgi:hypothetical protein